MDRKLAIFCQVATANKGGSQLTSSIQMPDPRPVLLTCLYRRFTMTITDRIEVNPKVMMGKPVIRGTRIPVELILRKISEGASEADLLEAYPKLTHEDIQAAIRYAADTLIL
jgi:uncharacterized protein (DUF433 family)